MTNSNQQSAGDNFNVFPERTHIPAVIGQTNTVQSNSSHTMHSSIPTPLISPRTPFLKKDGKSFKLTYPTEEAFRRMIRKAGLKSSFDVALQQSGVEGPLETVLKNTGLVKPFQDQMTEQRVGGFSRHGLVRWQFKSVKGGIVNLDTGSGKVWVQGGGGGGAAGETQAALDAIVGVAL